MGSMDAAVAGNTVGSLGIKPAVERRGHCVTAVAEVSHALKDQHMTVGAAVDIMADRTSFHAGCFMLIQKRTGFIGVALEAGLMLEPGQPLPDGGLMGIMTAHTIQDTFPERVPFI